MENTKRQSIIINNQSSCLVTLDRQHSCQVLISELAPDFHALLDVRHPQIHRVLVHVEESVSTAMSVGTEYVIETIFFLEFCRSELTNAKGSSVVFASL